MAEGVAVDDVIWPGTPARGDRPPPSVQPTVAAAGRLVREKGMDVLLRAFARVAARLPHARLMIAGDGPERGALMRLRDDLGLAARIDLLGQLEPDDLERRLGGAWVHALPSR